jgi:hypothetical protein
MSEVYYLELSLCFPRPDHVVMDAETLDTIMAWLTYMHHDPKLSVLPSGKLSIAFDGRAFEFYMQSEIVPQDFADALNLVVTEDEDDVGAEVYYFMAPHGAEYLKG